MTEARYTAQTVLAVQVWEAGKLFSLKTSRPEGYTFQAGQFARLGLPLPADADPTVWRAYSMVNAPGEDTLEFLSIVVPEGEFSPRLATLRPGDTLYVDKQPFGFLTTDRLNAGTDLWLLATGTGLSAFLSMLRHAPTWDSFDRIIVAHSVRHAHELAYAEELRALAQDPQRGPRFTYLPIVTREAAEGSLHARLTRLLSDGGLEQAAGAVLTAEGSSVMLCGNPDMLSEARKLLGERGFAPGRRGQLGNLAVENYW